MVLKSPSLRARVFKVETTIYIFFIIICYAKNIPKASYIFLAKLKKLGVLDCILAIDTTMISLAQSM